MIGPEGDFSTQEVEFALKNGYRAISLSMSRLRTETAGIVAVDTVAILNVKEINYLIDSIAFANQSS